LRLAGEKSGFAKADAIDATSEINIAETTVEMITTSTLEPTTEPNSAHEAAAEHEDAPNEPNPAVSEQAQNGCAKSEARNGGDEPSEKPESGITRGELTESRAKPMQSEREYWNGPALAALALEPETMVC
jgi:hypothetical protein